MGFLGSVSCSIKLIKSKGGGEVMQISDLQLFRSRVNNLDLCLASWVGEIVRTSDLQPVSQSTGSSLGLQLVSDVEWSLVGLSTSPVESDAISRYSVRTELNWRTPSWCPEHCLVMWRQIPSSIHWNWVWRHPLQCSCLENPRDGGASWAAVYGVAESDTTEVT